MVATDELKLASNAGVLSRFMPDGLQMLPYLAVALLYMESFRCTTLVVPDAMMVNDGDWSRITRVFQSAKLGLLRESKARGFSKVRVTMRKGQSGSLPVLLILNLIRLVAVRLSDE